MTTTPAPSITTHPLTGTGVGPFATNWRYAEAADVVVTIEAGGVETPPLSRPGDYSLTGASPLVSGGTVTLSVNRVPVGGWPDGTRLILRRQTARRQAVALPDTEGHKPRATEQAFDKAMRIAEEDRDTLGRAILVPPGVTPPVLPDPSSLEGEFIKVVGGRFVPSQPAIDGAFLIRGSDVAAPVGDLNAAYAPLLSKVINGSLTMELPTGPTTVAALAWDHPQADKIIVQGAAPVVSDLLSIESVTGAAGAWLVTGNVSDASAFEVGQVCLVDAVKPGWEAPGGYDVRFMAPGELRMLFFSCGTLEVSGVNGTNSGTATNTHLRANDIVIAGAHLRQVLSATASAFVMNAALDSLLTPARQYWMALAPLTGTVTQAGVVVAGTGTQFLSQYNVGDLFCPVGWGMRRVVSIASDTEMTVQYAQTIAAPVAHGSAVNGWRHEGAFVVTAVDKVNNRVTWRNTGRTAQSRPPKNLITAGKVTALPSTLTAAATAFLVGQAKTLVLKDVGLRGTGGGVGVDLRGADGNGGGHLKVNARVGVVGFASLVEAGVGSMIHGEAFHGGGASGRGVNLATACDADLSRARINGCGSINLFVGDRAGARYNGAIICAAGTDGVRREVGSGGWGDFSVVGYCGSKGRHDVGAVACHDVGSWIVCNSEEGWYSENGAGGGGRMTGLFSACNTVGINDIQASIEAQQALIHGNGNGVISTRGQITLNRCGVGGSLADNLLVIGKGATVSVSETHFARAGGDNIDVRDQGEVGGITPVFGTPGGYDGNVTTGGKIDLLSAATFTTTNISRNVQTANGSRITDGSGSVTNAPVKVSGAPGGVVAAAAQSKTLLHTLAVSGLKMNDEIVSFGANVAMPANVALTLEITAAGSLGIFGTNPTAAPINVGNRTYFAGVEIKP